MSEILESDDKHQPANPREEIIDLKKLKKHLKLIKVAEHIYI